MIRWYSYWLGLIPGGGNLTEGHRGGPVQIEDERAKYLTYLTTLHPVNTTPALIIACAWILNCVWSQLVYWDRRRARQMCFDWWLKLLARPTTAPELTFQTLVISDGAWSWLISNTHKQHYEDTRWRERRENMTLHKHRVNARHLALLIITLPQYLHVRLGSYVTFAFNIVSKSDAAAGFRFRGARSSILPSSSRDCWLSVLLFHKKFLLLVTKPGSNCCQLPSRRRWRRRVRSNCMPSCC